MQIREGKGEGDGVAALGIYIGGGGYNQNNEDNWVASKSRIQQCEHPST